MMELFFIAFTRSFVAPSTRSPPVSHATGGRLRSGYAAMMLKTIIPLAASLSTLCATMWVYLAA